MVTNKPSDILRRLDPEIVVKCFGTLIMERRLVLVSSNSGLLVNFCKTLVSFLYPLSWEYMFCPLLPSEYTTFCAAITYTPYLVGILANESKPFLEAVSKKGDKLLVVDIDNNRLMLSVGDEAKSFPSKYYGAVKKALSLSRNMTDPTGTQRDVVISEAFLQVMIEILGPATGFIDETSFQTEKFIRTSNNKNVQAFLQWFCESRMFDSFLKYWQHRHLLYQFLPISNKAQSMGLFERRTQHLRSVNRRPQIKAPKPTIHGNGQKPSVSDKVRILKEKFRNVF
jgi:hypothetical protein